MADTTVGFNFPYPALDAPDPDLIHASPGDALEQAREVDRVQDAALLDALRAGEEVAYEALVLRFEHVVYGLVSRILDDPSEAADVVQEVFLKVFRKVGGFRAESSLKTWIYRIAINEARNHRRWFGRHRAKEVGLEAGNDQNHEGSGMLDWLRDPSQSPYETAVDQEMHSLVEQALLRLSPNHRAALVLREVEGLAYDEIAAVLNVPPGTVRSRILRARDALRKELTDMVKPSSQRPLAPTFVSAAFETVSGFELGGKDNA